ncbi:MAG: di-heme enzyme [Deltaproteobacteria bacterium HGW-Deltaproteobacteria-14]|nr:MAG: di-heme enzyme [Deltaproteobacteria bacterium HGW-Deltaproteobacteria-14]
MTPRLRRALGLGLVLSCAAAPAAGCDDAAAPAPYVWRLPTGFPEPSVPADNPMSDAKVELGRRLFYDARLSGNQTQACASCHEQDNAFAEPLTTSVGATGQRHFRNAMSLTNVAYNTRQTWSNPIVVSLEQQALLPMFGETPVELGLAGLDDELAARLTAVPLYRELFSEAFPEVGGAITVDTITKAIGAFERTLISGTSPYDRFWYGKDTTALSPSAIRGLELFMSERLECFHCHGGFNFTAATTHVGTVFDETAFFNNGLYDVDGEGGYPAGDRGLYDVTGDPADMGRFKPPTLRNIALTAPYMHDGSVATLDEVIAMYEAGGRVTSEGPNAGDGRDSPLKSEFVRGFTLTAQERTDLLTFLESLSDEAFTVDPRFSDPWVEDETAQ